MATDPTPPAPAVWRPRTSLLVLLGLAAAGLVAYSIWPTGNTSTSAASPSNGQSPRVQATSGGAEKPPNVRLDALKTPPPEPSDAERNPFRFQPKAPPAAPGGMRGTGRENVAPQPPSGPPPPPPIPPIPLKFIGTLEGRGPGKVAIFSDSHGMPVYGHEGDIILGQYRIVRIGVESVVMEYADGRGRQVIREDGR
jgi:hypothetical protein